ncbi:MAG: Putrescine transport system permease protein potI [candidate division TM6 bacterium GW2011_GWF2_28_16]|nr:MAG: Putrescine transport system permease protein potI [candidate division TM6 bacterium GW2011_GWF2_28_16]
MVLGKRTFTKYLNPISVILTYVFLYLPIFILILFSFNDSSVSIEWTGFSFRWYYKLFDSPEIWAALGVSLIVAISSTLISLLLGTLFVISGRWIKIDFITSLFNTSVILPDIILAVSVLSIFAFLRIPLGYGSLIVGHTIIGLGFVIPIVKSRFHELDPELTEASLDLGAGYIQTFLRVIFPLLTPSLVASGLLVFTLSLDDFLISFFCSSPTVQTLSVYVYSMIKTWVDPTINAVSTLLLLVSSILVLLMSYLKVADKVVSNEH